MRIPQGLRSALASQTGGGGGGSSSTTDQYFNDVLLLLYGDGTNGSTAIVDSSSNNLPVTVVSNSQISTAQSKFGGSSLSFDGSSKLTIANTTALGTDDFTIEFWAYPTNLTGARCWTTSADPSYDKQGFWIGTYGTKLYWLVGSGGNNWVVIRQVGTVNLNQWNHIALTRSGAIFRAFIDGVQVDTVTNGVSLTNTNNNISVGGRNAGAAQFSLGYMDDFRITKGVARYTANFTPPTAGFSTLTPAEPYFYNTSLLLHGDGTNGSTDFVDSTGIFGKFYVNNGTRLAVNGEVPNGGTAYWVDILPSNAIVNYHSLDFDRVHNGSVTSGVYWVGSSYTTGNVTQARFDLRDFPTVTSVRIYAAGISGYNPYEARLLDSNKNVISNTTVTFNNSTFQWVTVPVTGSPAFIEFYPSSTNPRFYLNAIEVNGQHLISKPITVSGNAQISTAQSKFGGASMYFDGTGDGITAPSDASFDFGTGDFTIEFWMNPSNASGGWQVLVTRKYGATGGWRLYKKSGSTELAFYHPSGNYTTSGAGLTNGTWYHIAVVRNGSTLTTYVDGTSKGTDTISAAMSPTSADLEIGQGVYSFPLPYQGYLDDLRITKGVARYTANFTPPTSAFPNP